MKSYVFVWIILHMFSEQSDNRKRR